MFKMFLFIVPLLKECFCKLSIIPMYIIAYHVEVNVILFLCLGIALSSFRIQYLVKVANDINCTYLWNWSEKRRYVHDPNRNKNSCITHQTSGSNRSNNDEIAFMSKIRKFSSFIGRVDHFLISFPPFRKFSKLLQHGFLEFEQFWEYVTTFKMVSNEKNSQSQFKI